MVKKCLNLGCGTRVSKSTKTEEWTNLDITYNEGVDILWNCARGLPFNKDTFDFVLMSHLIEHLTTEEIQAVFTELFRVCKHKAKIKIDTPYWLHPASWGDTEHKQHLSEYYWEKEQIKGVLVGGKKIIRWQFEIDELTIKEGEMTCIYIVKKKDFKPVKFKFQRSWWDNIAGDINYKR